VRVRSVQRRRGNDPRAWYRQWATGRYFPVISVIVFAFSAMAAAADPDQSNVDVGPFTISSTVRTLDGFPYSIVVKTTTLLWTSADQLAEYRLEDDGERVSVKMTFKKKSSENICFARSSPMPLGSEPVPFFDTEVAVTWACTTEPPDNHVVAKTPELALAPYDSEIAAARSDFRKAYAAFLDQTRKLHGPSNVRCLQFARGNHGSVCVQLSDE
jgi:hypothetical protein